MIKQSPLVKAVANTTFDYLPFEGGLDLVTPSNQTRPGSLRDSKNVELDINNGYRWIDGYERFDGRPSPSEALFYRLNVTVTGEFTAGDVVTGATSGASGTVVVVAADDGQDYIILTKASGLPFTDTEDLEVSASKEGEASGTEVAGSAPTTELSAQYSNLAADVYRADIGAVPGSGSVLGVWLYDGTVYAFRNNAGATAAVMHESSSSGWTAVDLGLELAFTSGGTTEISDGDTITGKGSLATATVGRVVLESGSWGAGTATGKLIFASQTGTFVAENISTGGGGGSDDATIAGDSSAITLQPNGRFEFVNHNFGGESGAKKMYGVDGVNRGFEFDGTNFVPITTGMTLDQPTHVAVFKSHLFYSFAGSAQHSGTGFPYIWSPIFGASELAVGDDITAFKVQPGVQGGGTLAIISRNRVHMLYGTSTADWNLVEYREEVGGFAYSVQEFGPTMMMDDRGIISLETVQAHGNFKHGVVSRLVQPFVNTRKSRVKASCIAREKSQYRLFFNDQYALYVTMDNNKILGIMPQVFEHLVECISSQEASDGSESIYFGSDNGFVYQLDKGTSFDGEPIERSFTLHFHHAKSPRIEKSYQDASFEITGTGYAAFNFRYELGYNDSEIAQPPQRMVDASFSQALWDNFIWDNFVWDGVVLKPSLADLDGDGENISLIFFASSDYYDPLTFSGALIRHVLRRQLRS